MTEQELQQWLAANGGTSLNYTTKNVQVDNPDPATAGAVPKITIQEQTWINPSTGKGLSVTHQPGQDTYQIVGQSNTAASTTGTEAKPPVEKDENGRHWVWAPNPGGPNAGGQWQDVGPAAAPRQTPLTDYEQAQLDRQAVQDNLAGRRESLAEQQANRPVYGAPASGNPRQVTRYDPTTGELTAVDNPAFDAALASAQDMKEKLATAIQLNKLTSEQAAQQYQEWFDRNIRIPQAEAQEARARAEEIRQAQAAEDRRQQFAADYERGRQTTALGQGQEAVRNALAMLPYTVGPQFESQMSSAINSLAKGSSAGVNFTSDAFNFQAPDVQKIAENATARALAHISPYAAAIASAGDRPLPVADYSGIQFGAEPPPQPGPQIDLTPYINASLGGGGGGGGQQAPAQAEAPPEEVPQ